MADSCSAEAEVSPRLTFYDLEEVAFFITKVEELLSCVATFIFMKAIMFRQGLLRGNQEP